jgi:hypothetical protein
VVVLLGQGAAAGALLAEGDGAGVLVTASSTVDRGELFVGLGE